MTGCHNIHAQLHGPFYRSFLYSAIKPIANFIYIGVLLSCCDILYYTIDAKLFHLPQPVTDSENILFQL